MKNESKADDPLLALADAIATGERVDWLDAEARVSETHTPATVRQFRLLEMIAAFHRWSSGDAQHAGEALVLVGAEDLAPTDASVDRRRWGRLEILEKVGEGAYGEVFRAWDPKLSRQVALKLLRENSDAELGSAVIREASLMARVTHPNVVTIYGADLIEGRVGIWMEFIRGRTLEQLLTTSGPFSPRETALIGVELCRALGAVHRAGFVHRDIKAQNVMREWGGRLVLMDFGTGRELNESGIAPGIQLYGTPLCAAPEVLEGKEATSASDIYSLGVLLFHLLTGAFPVIGRTIEEVRRAHWGGHGKRLRDVLPDLPPGLMLAIDGAIHHNPAERHGSVSEMQAHLMNALAGTYVHDDDRPATLLWPWLAAAAALLCVATALIVMELRPRDSRLTAKLVVPLAPAAQLKEDSAFNRPLSTALTVSPNGNRIAFVGQTGVERQIYVRHMMESTAELLDETDGASSPTFSPDGAWLAFVSGNLVRKVPSTGGEAVTICEVVRRVRPPGSGTVLPGFAESDVYGLAWRGNSELVFGRFAGGLWTVSAAGGSPVQLTILDESSGEFAHRLPHVLPGGDRVLYTVVQGVAAASTKLVVHTISTGERRVLVEDAADGRFIQTGQLVFMRRGQLMAASFDPRTLQFAGQPVKLLDNVMQSLFSYRNQLNVGAAQYAFSADARTLVYVPGPVFPDESRTLVWVDTEGKTSPTGIDPGAYMRPDVSPDGTAALFTCWSGGQPNVCAFDFDRQVFRRITEGLWPLWSTDSSRIVFGRLSATGVYNLFWMPLGGSGEPELLMQGTHDQWAGSWSPDGSALAYVETSPKTDNDIWILSVKDRKPRAFLRTVAREDHPEFSPTGEWMAYASNESGRDEVYVTEYPTPKTVYQVSTEGGTGPVWSRDGRQLYFAMSNEPDGLTVTAVDVRLDPRLTLSKPRAVISGEYLALASVRSYDISADGKRFLLVRAPRAQAPVTHVNVILNWDQELRAILPQ